MHVRREGCLTLLFVFLLPDGYFFLFPLKYNIIFLSIFCICSIGVTKIAPKFPKIWRIWFQWNWKLPWEHVHFHETSRQEKKKATPFWEGSLDSLLQNDFSFFKFDFSVMNCKLKMDRQLNLKTSFNFFFNETFWCIWNNLYSSKYCFLRHFEMFWFCSDAILKLGNFLQNGNSDSPTILVVT